MLGNFNLENNDIMNILETATYSQRVMLHHYWLEARKQQELILHLYELQRSKRPIRASYKPIQSAHQGNSKKIHYLAIVRSCWML